MGGSMMGTILLFIFFIILLVLFLWQFFRGNAINKFDTDVAKLAAYMYVNRSKDDTKIYDDIMMKIETDWRKKMWSFKELTYANWYTQEEINFLISQIDNI